MKKTLLLLMLFAIPFVLSAQYFKSPPLYAGHWGGNTILKISTVDSTYTIKIAALSKRVRGSKFRIKHVKINDDAYQLLRVKEVVHIKDEFDERLLMTSNHHMKVVMADGKTFMKNRYNRRNFTYLDENEEVIIEARLRDHIFHDVIEITMHEEEPLLLALCVEMLSRLARERIWL